MNTYKERLAVLRSIYGGNVLCTDGLFHIIDSNHKEIYLNRNTGEIDKRGKYRTVAVLDKTILAEVVNDIKIRYVLLSKRNLECLHKTTEELVYVDNNIMYDTNGFIISHTGKKLLSIDKIESIENIHNRYYLVHSSKMFNDRLIEYIRPSDKLNELTENKHYSLTVDLKENNKINITNMVGGKYKYDIFEHTCYNEFTAEKVEDIQIWTVK